MNASLSDIERNQEGYLIDYTAWTPVIATALANEEGIELTEAHWMVIYFLRDFYEEYQIAPAMRPLIKAIQQKYGPEKGNSIFLAQLFPGGAAKQANKIAGLPKPVRCI